MTIPPVRREVLVAAPPERAFELFTARIGAWWPLRGFSVFVEDNEVCFEGDLLVERATDGRETVWAEVLAWEPPELLALSWHPGHETAHAGDVRITFEAHDDGTLVTLIHSGWERTPHPERSADAYGRGWPTVLAAFVEHVASS